MVTNHRLNKLNHYFGTILRVTATKGRHEWLQDGNLPVRIWEVIEWDVIGWDKDLGIHWLGYGNPLVRIWKPLVTLILESIGNSLVAPWEFIGEDMKICWLGYENLLVRLCMGVGLLELPDDF